MNREFLKMSGCCVLALILAVALFGFGYMVGGQLPDAQVEAKSKYGRDYWSGLDSKYELKPGLRSYHQSEPEPEPEPEPLPSLSQSQCEKILLQLLVERYESFSSEKQGMK